MTNERANELFREYRRTGDIKLRNELVENYMYVAEILAKKFCGRGVEYDDLLQVASEALISGVEKYDPDMGNMFSTYITPTITGMIRNYFRDFSRSVRVPRKIYALSAKVKAEINDYYKANGVKPTVKQLASLLGESEENIIEAMECHSPVSLDTTVKGEDSESLRTEISKLSKIQQEVVKLRYLQGKSQAETGKILGVSQMFVSRAERKIVEILREALS